MDNTIFGFVPNGDQSKILIQSLLRDPESVINRYIYIIRECNISISKKATKNR